MIVYTGINISNRSDVSAVIVFNRFSQKQNQRECMWCGVCVSVSVCLCVPSVDEDRVFACLALI